MPAAKISVSMGCDLLDMVDRVRGDVPRSVWIVRRLESALQKECNVQGLTRFVSVSQKPSKKVVRNQTQAQSKVKR